MNKPILKLKVGDIIKVGENAYLQGKKRNNSYAGEWGYVFKCGAKCKKRCGLRIQFLNWGNNEKQTHFDLRRCRVIRPTEERY